MHNWEIKEIKTTYYVYDIEDKNQKKPKKEIKINKSPTENQMFFEHAKNGNIDLIREMLDEKIVKINDLDLDYKETIGHIACQKNNYNLIVFCIENGIDLFKKSYYEQESIFFECSSNASGLKLFKKVWSNLNKKDFQSIILERDVSDLFLVNRLLRTNLGRKKLNWLKIEFKDEWNEFISDENHFNEIIENTTTMEESLYIKGLYDLKIDLEKTTKKTKKIKIKQKI